MIRQYPLQWQADWLDRPPLADAQAVDSGADWLHRPPLAEAQAVDSVPWTAGQTDSTALL